jgi:predicted nucleic acid-binding protein
LNGALKPLALVADASVAAKLFLPEEHAEQVVNVFASAGLSAAVLDLALTYDLSIYDACYAAAARQHKAALVTADQKLVEGLVNTEVKVLWLGDIQ